MCFTATRLHCPGPNRSRFGIEKPARVPRGFRQQGPGLTRPVSWLCPSEKLKSASRGAAIAAGLQLVAYLLVVLQALQPGLAQRGDVDEHVLAALLRVDEAEACFDSAAEFFEKAKNTVGLLQLFLTVARMELVVSRTEPSDKYLDQARQVSKDLGDPEHITRAIEQIEKMKENVDKK